MDKSASSGEASKENLQSEADYDYIKEIARGGFGIVYLFRRKKRTELDEEEYCAGKFIYAHLFGSEGEGGSAAYQRAFEGLQNFQSLTVRSEDLLKILYVRQRHDEGYFCYMMELADDVVTGRRINPDSYQPRTLNRELTPNGIRRRLPAKECVRIAVALAQGLQTLHSNDFIHRDVRPSNIIFVNGVAKIADIDLLAGINATLTSYIPREYAAPEASHSKRADIYSFGKTLYEMSMGLPPKDFPTLPQDLRHWEDHQTVLHINQVIAKACANDLRMRYGSANELLEDLKRIERGEPPLPPPRWGTKPNLIWIVVLLAVIGTAGSIAFLKSRQVRPEHESPVSLIHIPVAVSRAQIPKPGEIGEARARLQAKVPAPAMQSPVSIRVQYAASLLDDFEHSSPLPDTYARFEAARDFAAQSAKADVAIRACDLIQEYFAISASNAVAMKIATLEVARQNAGNKGAFKDIADAAFSIGFRALAMDDYQNAEAAAKTGTSAAENIPDGLWSNQATFLNYLVEDGRARYKQVEKFSNRIGSNPDDAEANMECGKYLCFTKNAWDRGLRMLRKGNNEKLAGLAKDENAGASTIDAQMKLGDAWWSLALETNENERKFYFCRACYWYAKALSSEASPEVQVRAKQRREEFFKAYPPQPCTLTIRITVEGGANLVITSDQILLKNSHGVRGVKINTYSWGDFRPGGPEILRNVGETRFLPDGLDFAKASIIKQAKSKSWAKVANFEATPDRIHISLVDSPAGSADFMIVISF